MKSTTVALGFLAGVATATYNHPRHFHSPRPYYRRDNGTEPSQTTLTVQVTQVHTVTSCAPTVTNCPARNATATGNDAYATIPASDLITSDVTQVVDLTTTVCPVAEASGIASSVSSAHSAGLITGTTRDATATSDNSGATASVVTSASVGTTDVPLTYTVGPETAKSVITTTVKSTYTAQVTVTMTKSGSTEASSNSPQDTSSEATTTTTSTSTGTRTVTISKASTATASGYPTASTTGTSSAEDVTGNSASGSDSDASCAEASTVTVTAPASTVYVTVGASGAAASSVATSSAPAAAATGASTTDNSATGSDAGDDEDDSSDDDESCEADDSSSVVYATATQTVVPYPVASGAANGTYPVPTGSYRMKN